MPSTLNDNINLPHIETSFVVLPRDTNHFGYIQGGDLVRAADILAWTLATRFCRMNVVTAKISEWNFIKPVCQGEHIIIYAQMIKVNNSSMEIKVNIQGEKLLKGIIFDVANAFFTMVAVDSEGNPKKIEQKGNLNKKG